MSKLDTIFNDMCLGTDGHEELVYLGDFHEAVNLKQQIKDLFNELIGDGQEFKAHELNTASSQDGWREYNKKQFSMKDIDHAIINELKELRQKVQEL